MAFGLDDLAMATIVAEGAGSIAGAFGGGPKRAGAFSNEDLRRYLNQLYQIAGFGFAPGKGLFREPGGPNLEMFGIGPESRRRAMTEIEAQYQPKIARGRAMISRGAGYQPGLLQDYELGEGANLLNLYRGLQIEDTRRQSEVMSELLRLMQNLLQV